MSGAVGALQDRRARTLPAIGSALVLAAGAAMCLVVALNGPLTRQVRWVIATLVVALAIAALAWRSSAAVPATLAAGTVAAATGHAIGYERLHTDWSPAGKAAGLVLLVAGIGLFGWSVIRVLTLARKPVAPLVAAPLVIAVWLLWGHVVIPIADGVRFAIVLSVPLNGDTPAMFGLDYLDVEFPATDGVTLRGWYLPSANGAALSVVHGSDSNRTSTLPHAAALARSGFGVLLFDSRGHGTSDGTAMDLGWYGDQDIGGAVDFLAAREDVDASRIGVVGLSLGGEQAIGAAATDDRIAAVVADGASYRRAGDWSPRATSPLGRFADWVTFTAADVLSAAAPPPTLASSLAAAIPVPVLLIASGAGREAEAAADLRAIAPDDVEVVEFPDVGHLGAFDAHRDKWTSVVRQFLERHLLDVDPARRTN